MKKYIVILGLLFSAVFSFAQGIPCVREDFVYEKNGKEEKRTVFYFGNFAYCPEGKTEDWHGDFYLYTKSAYIDAYNPLFCHEVAAFKFIPEGNVKSSKRTETTFDEDRFYRILADAFYKIVLSITCEKWEGEEDSQYLPQLMNFISEESKFFSKESLRVLRNTIFAKYGYVFSSSDLRSIFSSLEWYNPKTVNDFRISDMNQVDRAWLNLISIIEKSLD